MKWVYDGIQLAGSMDAHSSFAPSQLQVPNSGAPACIGFDPSLSELTQAPCHVTGAGTGAGTGAAGAGAGTGGTRGTGATTAGGVGDGRFLRRWKRL